MSRGELVIKNGFTNGTHKKMPIFRCSCGAKILVVPDLQAMDRAMKNHSIEHRKATGQRLTEEMIADGLLSALTEYFFKDKSSM